ncbi:DIS3-like exonuclease 2 [Araneus ventricosus]|uniref:DIS3-like exonuclease 2 n=1 Tax=Araneus ventricosus TaxID=182803 RepID=A0A4Y2IYI3_ARAVE|nr:DIS3-like exonuclease 2 [Araneus ventricosus]
MEENIQNGSCKPLTSDALIESSNIQDSATETEVQNPKGGVKKKSGVRTKMKHEQSLPSENSPTVRSPKSRSRNKKSAKDKSTDPVSSETAKSSKSSKKPSSGSSDAFSDISAKLNSSGNMRNPKQGRRSSVPNHYVELQSQNSASPDISSPRVADRKSSGYRSKTPDCQTTPNKPRHQGKRASSGKQGLKFEPYIPLFQVQQGLKRGEFIEGALRINPRNYEDAYVNSPDGKMDIYIGGMQDRNRALAGDIVVVQINPKQEWKVLCDAIKDYQEKTGESIADTVCVPIPSPPCKVHTPDKLLRSRPQSSNSWGSTFEDHGPDTLKILGVDKLAKQMEDFTMEQKRSKGKNKRKSKINQQSKENSSGRTSTSYSHESSEDHLDKMSPKLEHETSLDVQSNIKPTNFEKTDASSPQKGESSGAPSNLETGYAEMVYPACDMDKIGTFTLEIEQNSNTSKNWENEESALNIVVSPEELLSIDGNSILEHQSNYEMDDSDFGGIIVPPGDLSGDEFTDSASVGSSQSQHMDQVLEDAEFLACQQDADNNNIVFDNVTNIVNQFNTMDIRGLAPTGSVPGREKSLELECRVQHGNAVPSLHPIEVNSESVVCSSVSEIQLSKIHSSSDENIDADPLIIGHFNHLEVGQNINESVASQSSKKSKHKKRKRKRQEKKESVNDNANVKIPNFDFSSLTVEDIMRHPQWPRFIQKTGKVVHVLERKHSRIAAGHLKLCPDKNRNWALFSPNDSRVPRIMVPMSDCPPNFYNRSGDYTNVLFLAEIADWNETSTFARGKLIKCLGNTGDVEVETEGILVENAVDFSDFPNEVLDCLPQEPDWRVPDHEIRNRRDFRKECVFTIDPSTARDMDDAVSCTVLDNGNYEVGVHIADVTYFVEEGSKLDLFAKERSTSVYLVQKVIPMLPRLLCDNLCSLNPGQGRLTFSVVWEMTPEGEICRQWIGRSVINSCSKLSYEHAQSMLENPERKEWNPSEFPPVYGDFTLNDIATRVYQLHLLALQLREKRFYNGALRLDQVKLQFTLDPETGLPSGFNVFVHKDSNKLIEEFMLLANMSVAKHIYETFPSLSLLRRHPAPQSKMMADIVSMCETMGVILDPSSSGTLQSSIAQYKSDDYLSKARVELLMHLCSKPMNCALYFCTGVLEEPSMFHHYALNVPLYTHFTSPIRRYPDILVHRLLGASLKYNRPPGMAPEVMEKCAVHCNDKKYNAKKVSDQSAEIFLSAFIRKMGCVHAKAMVLGVMDHSFDCLILDMGIIKRVYCDKLPLLKKEFKRTHGVNQLNLFWKDPSLKGGLEQVIVMFALVDVTLITDKDYLQIKVTLRKPGT